MKDLASPRPNTHLVVTHKRMETMQSRIQPNSVFVADSPEAGPG